jgi:hypothetical protein
MTSGSGRVFAIAIRLRNADVNKLELILDDVESRDEQNLSWHKWAFFTSMGLNRHRALCHELTDAEYARIGQAVMARLVALRALEGEKE